MSLGKRISIAVFAAALSFGSLSLGGNGIGFSANASAQEISADHLAAARRAINASRSTAQMDQLLPRMAEGIKSELIRNNPDKEAQLSIIVDEAAIALAPRRGDLESEAAQIFARVFTADELNAIADFYESDAGVKFLQESPIILREIQRASQVWGNGVQRDLAQAIEDKMTEAGLR